MNNNSKAKRTRHDALPSQAISAASSSNPLHSKPASQPGAAEPATVSYRGLVLCDPSVKLRMIPVVLPGSPGTSYPLQTSLQICSGIAVFRKLVKRPSAQNVGT